MQISRKVPRQPIGSGGAMTQEPAGDRPDRTGPVSRAERGKDGGNHFPVHGVQCTAPALDDGGPWSSHPPVRPGWWEDPVRSVHPCALDGGGNPSAPPTHAPWTACGGGREGTVAPPTRNAEIASRASWNGARCPPARPQAPQGLHFVITVLPSILFLEAKTPETQEHSSALRGLGLH